MGEKEVLVNLDELENSSLALNQQQEADYNGDFEDSQNTPLLQDSLTEVTIPSAQAVNAKTDDELRAEREAQAKLSQLNVWRLLALAKKEKWRLSLAIVSLLISSASFLYIPTLFGRIIDTVLNTEEGGMKLTTVVILLFIFTLISAVFTFFRASLFTIAGESIVMDLRKRLYRSIVSQEIGFFDATRTGELINRLSSDCTVIQNTVTVNVSMGLRFTLQAIGGIIILFFIAWKLTLLMLAAIPFIVIASRIYGKYVRTLSKQVQQKLADASTAAEEALSSMRTVRAFVAEDHESRRYDLKVFEAYEAAKKRALTEGLFTAVASLFAEIAITGVLWYGGTLVLSGEMSVGTLTSFIIYTLSIGGSFGALSSLYGDLMKAVGASERVFELLDRKPLVRHEGGLSLAHNSAFHIRFENVQFAYPSRPDVTVLDGLNLDLSPGKVVALVGPSGGGKSTIAQLIEGFYLPTAGRITIDGVDLSLLDPQLLRRNIAIVSQEPTLFALSIAENIVYGLDDSFFANEEDKMNRIIQAAKMANAHSFIMSFPEGYQTLVGERGQRLSGGQKQRIAIARALVRDPKILLLDEATSALDAESEYQVKQALDELLRSNHRTYTVLVIAHRLSTVKNADEVAVVLKGKIVERGTHTELLNKNGVYKRLVARQLSQD